MSRLFPISLSGLLKIAACATIVLSLAWMALKEHLIANPCADDMVMHELNLQIPQSQTGHGIAIWNIETVDGHFWQRAYSCKGNMTELTGLADLSSTPMSRIRYRISDKANEPKVKLLSVTPDENARDSNN